MEYIAEGFCNDWLKPLHLNNNNFLIMFVSFTEIQDYIREDQYTYSERQFRSRKYNKNERRYQRRQKQQQQDRTFDVR
jgi:hypothetical protein